MLPEQHDILFSFLAIVFAVFGVFVFGNVVLNCRERELSGGKMWGGIFGIFAIASFMMTVHMFSLNQGDQLSFFFGTYLWVIILMLLAWGIFFKSNNIESQSPP
ncbi:MAG: amino acid transporter, partial [Nitrospinales bacterium]